MGAANKGKKTSRHQLSFRHQTITGKKIELYPLETNTHLEAIVNYTLEDGREAGAMLLNLGSDAKPEYKIRFVWECNGYHDTNILDVNSAAQIISSIEALGNEIPQYEKLRVELQTFCDIRHRHRELVDRFDRIPKTANNILRFAMGQRLNLLKKLNDEGKRRPKRIYLMGDYSPTVKALGGNLLEVSIRRALDIYHKVAGSYDDLAVEEIDRVLLAAYENSFTTWDDLFRDKLQIGYKPLDGEQVWQFCYNQLNRFNDLKLGNEPPPAPQLIHFNLKTGTVGQEIREQSHPTSVMLQSPSSVPTSTRDCTIVDGKYVASLVLASQPSGFKSANGISRSQNQLNFLWKLLHKRSARDLRIVLEITRIENNRVRYNNQKLIQQAQAYKKEAEAKGRIDLGADMQLEDAIKAERQAISGDATLEFAVTMFVARDSPSAARAAARELASHFQSPARLTHEVDIADEIWTSSLPFYGRTMLAKYEDRRERESPLFSSAYYPLVRSISQHHTGIEFIATRGGEPIYYDPFSHQGHTAVVGQTRSGKSLLMAEIITVGLSMGMPFTILDQPPSSEASTFEPFTKALGGSYINIFTSQFNFLEPPSIPRHISEETRTDAIAQHYSYVRKILLGMIVGAKDRVEGINSSLVGSAVSTAIAKFYDSQEIKLRIDRAKRGGIGSPEWAQYPILADFKKFCSVERLQLKDATEETVATLEFMQMRIQAWIDGEYGKTLNAPSSVPLDASLITIALRQVSDGDLAIVFGTIAQSIAMRRAIVASLNPNGSAWFVDEVSSLTKQAPLSLALAETMVNCLKMGMRVFIAAQELASVFSSAGGEQIRNAIFYYLVGRIDPQGVEDFVRLGIPEQIVRVNASSEFAPDTATNSSQWAIRVGDVWAHGRIYLPQTVVDLTANNLDERLARAERESTKQTTIATR
jgi:hypothetical protein